MLVFLAVAISLLAALRIVSEAEAPEAWFQTGFRVPRRNRLARLRAWATGAAVEAGVIAVGDLIWVARATGAVPWHYALIWWVLLAPALVALRAAYGHAEEIVAERWVEADETDRARTRHRTRRVVVLAAVVWVLGLFLGLSFLWTRPH